MAGDEVESADEDAEACGVVDEHHVRVEQP
jgi:hypothetical protein